MTLLKDKNSLIKAFIYLSFFCLILYIHLPMKYISDDAVIAPTVENYTLLANFISRYNSNGRFLTDVLANLFYRMPMDVWKVFDSLIYVIIAHLTSFLFTKRDIESTIATCVLILFYPFAYLKSAGYIATTTNYVYPLLGLLLIMLPFKFLTEGKKVALPYYIVTLASVLYVTNHDQYAVVLICGLIFSLVYAIVNKSNKTITVSLIIHLIISICSYLFMFFTPGHINRMNNTAEMLRWLPQYADWSFFQKAYQGFSTTVGNLLFNDVTLFSVFCFLIFLISLYKENLLDKILAAIPLGIVFLPKFFGNEAFITTYSYSCKMPELCKVEIGNSGFFALILSVSAVVLIFYNIYNCVPDKKSKWTILILLVLASLSREMMGFSATLYASSFRTFTFFIYALIFCSLILLKEIKQLSAEKDSSLKHCYLLSIIFATALKSH